MRRFFSIVSFLGLVACTAIEQPELRKITDEEGFTVQFALGGEAAASIESKATSQASEAAVLSYKLVIFKDNNVYKIADASGTGDQLKTVAVNLDEGTYDCWAVVNAPSNFSVDMSTTKAQFIGKTSTLADNSTSKFVMTGVAANKAITSSTGSVQIDVYRHISKVELDKISVDFSGTYYAGKQLTVNKIYLTNVSSEATFEHQPKTVALNGTWYNKLGYASSDLNALLYEVSSLTIGDGGSNSTPHYFYAYPNSSTADASLDNWPSSGSAPCTRLVLECTLDGKTCFYHVDIKGMECNTLYKITECKIKNTGGPDPEHNLTTFSVSFTLNIQNWATGFTESWTFDESGAHKNS